MPDARFEYLQGTAAMLRGAPDEAIAAFRRSLALDDNLIEARVNLLDAYQAAGKLAEADAEAEELLRRRPEDQAVLTAVAGLREQEGRMDDALALMRSPFVNLSPASNAYPSYLRMLVGAQHWEEASLESRWAFKMDTLWRPQALLAAGLALLHFHDYPLARERLAQLDVANFSALIDDWARRFARSGALPKLRALLDESVAAAPGDASLEELRRRFASA
jgi:tetratricopeptide (TPR) repeat protein